MMVDVESIRSTSVRLFWEKIDTSPDQIRGFFRGYRVSVLNVFYVIIILVIVILRTVLMMLLSSLGVVERVRVMNTGQKVAASPWTKPTDLSHKPACRHLGNYRVGQKKVNPKCSTHNFVKYWPILKILSLLQSPENLQCSDH